MVRQRHAPRMVMMMSGSLVSRAVNLDEVFSMQIENKYLIQGKVMLCETICRAVSGYPE